MAGKFFNKLSKFDMFFESFSHSKLDQIFLQVIFVLDYQIGCTSFVTDMILLLWSFEAINFLKILTNG